MKNRKRLVAVALGAVMLMGSAVAFPSTAGASPGDLSITGSINLVVPVSITASGLGGTTGSSDWQGFVVGSGGLDCIVISTLIFDDQIDWTDNGSGPDPATQTISNAAMVIDTTACEPPSGVCVLFLDDPQELESDDFAEVTPGIREGDFESTAAPIGGFEITEDPTIEPPEEPTCESSGLADLIRLGLQDTSMNTGVGSGDAAASLGAQLTKSLEL